MSFMCKGQIKNGFVNKSLPEPTFGQVRQHHEMKENHLGLCVIFCSDGVLCLLGHGSRWTSSKGAKEKETPRSSRIITIWKVLSDGDSSVVGEQEQGYYCKDTYASCMYPTSLFSFP